MRVIILSVPYTEPYPMVAPVLLSACLNNAGISSMGIDFSVKLLEALADRPYWGELRNFLTHGYAHERPLPRRALIDCFKFTRRFLLDLKKYNPEWIGLSIFTGESLDYGLILSHCIRKYMPGVKIIAGGKGLEARSAMTYGSDMNYQVWINQGVVDTVIAGDGEIALIDAIKNDRRGVINPPQQTKQDLDNIPLPAWNQYDLHLYSKLARHRDLEHTQDEPYMAVTSSKGCVRNCTFCDVASYWPNFIFRDPAKVAEEMISNYHATGIKKFWFTDSLINGSVATYREINRILAERIPRELKYAGHAIFRGRNQMPAEDFDLAAQAGCHGWIVGVETGSERLRFDMRKKFTNEDLDWSVRQLHRVGIQQDWLIMVGYPSETEEDFEMTLDMLRKYAHLNRNQLIRYSVSPTFALLENSPLAQNAELMDYYGLTHNRENEYYQKFWTSTKYTDNTFDVRLRRWRTLINLASELEYHTHEGFAIEKFMDEMNSLEKLWNEKRSKIIPIYSV